ncbi:MAG: hypothetical protein PHH00_03685 [Candidatus Nanoarchaeia archaeon]|nr:hypothetical protein [Candidatus Nanoarchaeia archaeon]
MTWIVATLIIVVILSVSVFLASLVGQSKTFPSTDKIDLFAKKSLTAYLLTKDSSGSPVYNQIAQEEQLNDFNGNLAKKIFEDLYKENYPVILLAAISKSEVIIPNSFFPKLPPTCGAVIYYMIKLEEENGLLLALSKGC